MDIGIDLCLKNSSVLNELDLDDALFLRARNLGHRNRRSFVQG